MYMIFAFEFKQNPTKQASKRDEMSEELSRVVQDPVGIMAAKNPEVKNKLDNEGLASTANYLMKNADANLRAEFQTLFIESARNHGYKDDIAIGNLWLELEEYISRMNASRISAFEEQKKAADAMMSRYAVGSGLRKTQEGQEEAEEDLAKERKKFGQGKNA